MYVCVYVCMCVCVSWWTHLMVLLSCVGLLVMTSHYPLGENLHLIIARSMGRIIIRSMGKAVTSQTPFLAKGGQYVLDLDHQWNVAPWAMRGSCLCLPGNDGDDSTRHPPTALQRTLWLLYSVYTHDAATSTDHKKCFIFFCCNPQFTLLMFQVLSLHVMIKLETFIQ